MATTTTPIQTTIWYSIYANPTSQFNKGIELDIESLSPAVLTKLRNFNIKPYRDPFKGTVAAGGVERKRMDKAAESERIEKLLAQIDQFGKAGGDVGGVGGDGYDNDARSSNGSHSSNSH
ncbi:hypothetical protein BDV93DRAFT_555270 [Ceratobasidium sp. AG-I]|nr:hypothetical protein BDV93DRAFT_555270 [Ceratobasidium sp. AG-I]